MLIKYVWQGSKYACHLGKSSSVLACVNNADTEIFPAAWNKTCLKYPDEVKQAQYKIIAKITNMCKRTSHKLNSWHQVIFYVGISLNNHTSRNPRYLLTMLLFNCLTWVHWKCKRSLRKSKRTLLYGSQKHYLKPFRNYLQGLAKKGFA